MTGTSPWDRPGADPIADLNAALALVFETRQPPPVTVVVCHPDDAVTVRAAELLAGLALEVHESRLCPPGTAYAFPKGGGPFGEVPLPPAPGDAA